MGLMDELGGIVGKKIGQLQNTCSFCHQPYFGHFAYVTPCCRKGMCNQCPPDWAQTVKNYDYECPLCSKKVSPTVVNTLAK